MSKQQQQQQKPSTPQEDGPTREEMLAYLIDLRKQNKALIEELEMVRDELNSRHSNKSRKESAREIYRLMKEFDKEEEEGKKSKNSKNSTPTPTPTSKEESAPVNPAIAHMEGMTEGKKRALQEGKGWVVDSAKHWIPLYTPANAAYNEAGHLACSSLLHQGLSLWKIVELGVELTGK